MSKVCPLIDQSGEITGQGHGDNKDIKVLVCLLCQAIQKSIINSVLWSAGQKKGRTPSSGDTTFQPTNHSFF